MIPYTHTHSLSPPSRLCGTLSVCWLLETLAQRRDEEPFMSIKLRASLELGNFLSFRFAFFFLFFFSVIVLLCLCVCVCVCACHSCHVPRCWMPFTRCLIPSTYCTTGQTKSTAFHSRRTETTLYFVTRREGALLRASKPWTRCCGKARLGGGTTTAICNANARSWQRL